MGIDLISLLQAVAGRRAVVVGDTILDVYVRGTTRGLCREAPVPAVTVQSTEAVPGGAANAAVNLAALGGRASLVSLVGDDASGGQLLDALRAAGVSTDGVVRAAGTQTAVKRRVVVGNHAVVRLDEGCGAAVPAAAESQLRGRLAAAAAAAEALVVSDYGHGTLTGPLFADLAELRSSVPVLVVDAKDVAAYAALRPTAVTPSYAEAVRLLGLPALDEENARVRQIIDAGAALLDATGAELVVTTLAADGAVLFERDRPPFHSRVRERTDKEVVGAGDAFTAAFALALSAGADPPVAAELATLAAATAAARTSGTAVCFRDGLSARLRDTAKILTPAEVSALARAEHERQRRVVFTNGCFDLVHEGHVAFLSQAKALGDVLIVGVNDDESVRSLKGTGRPVVELTGRMRLLAALSCVDHVVPFSGTSPVALIEAVRPDVFAKGGDYAPETLPETDLLRRLGTDIRILSYLENRSTTGIIERVRSLS